MKTPQLEKKSLFDFNLRRGVHPLALFVLAIVVGLQATSLQAQYAGGDGTTLNPFQIATADQLNFLGTDSANWDKEFKVVAPIDLTGLTYNVIGEPNQPFTGVFDGDCFPISNLNITTAANNAIGLFGTINGSGAVVRDVQLIDAVLNLATISSVGAIAGNVIEGTLNECVAKNVTVAGFESVGGLVGSLNISAVVTNCYSSGSVTGRDNVGGLGGFNLQGSVSRSFSSCTVNTDGDLFGNGFGGLLGKNGGSVENCYARGAVTGNISNGGLIGVNEPPAAVTNCFSANTATGVSLTGGLLGNNGGLVVDGSFWDEEVSLIATMCGPGSIGTCDDNAGQTTSAMQDPNFYLANGWDFITEIVNGVNDIWKLCQPGSGYPQIWWEKFLLNPVLPNVTEYEFPLDGNQQFETVLTPAAGAGRAQVDSDTGELTWDITFENLKNGLDSATAAHFHGPALRKQNADVEVNIGSNSRALLSGKMYSICPVVLTAEQIQDLHDHLWYVNVHSTAHASGEIRGQVAGVKTPSALTISKLKIKAGKDRSIPQDDITVSGTFDAEQSAYENADFMFVSFGTETFIKYEEVIDTLPEVKKGKVTYKGPPTGAIKAIKLDFVKKTFNIQAKKADLSCLESPLILELRFGDYCGEGTADEDVINGPKKKIPLCLLAGVVDAVRVDSAKVTTRTKAGFDTDSLKLKGEIAPANLGLNLTNVDVQIFWNAIDEVLDEGDFSEIIQLVEKPTGSGKWTYKKPKDGTGFVSKVTIDLAKCKLAFDVKDAGGLQRDEAAVLTVLAGPDGSLFSASHTVCMDDGVMVPGPCPAVP